MVRKVKFVGICVRDQDRALNFYLNKLGFTLVTDQPMGSGKRWIEVKPAKGETGVALFTPDGQEDRIGTFVNTSWDCDDIENTYADLKSKGVEFESPPQKQAWGTFVVMIDSEGNKIVLSTSR